VRAFLGWRGSLLAEQAFVAAADQAGDLSSSGFLPADLTLVEADLGRFVRPARRGTSRVCVDLGSGYTGRQLVSGRGLSD
jgi:hypothetical protein